MKGVEGEEERVSSIHLYGDLQFWLNHMNYLPDKRPDFPTYAHYHIWKEESGTYDQERRAF